MDAHPDKADRDSWQTTPMPKARARIGMNWRFTREERERMGRGLVPREMEDKWFVFLEGGRLHFHRSWTGFEIYEMRLEPDGDGVRVVEAWVNRDREQYEETDDAYDIAVLRFLVDRLLLGHDGPFPERGDLDETSQALHSWRLVGNARAADEEPPGRFTILPDAEEGS